MQRHDVKYVHLIMIKIKQIYAQFAKRTIRNLNTIDAENVMGKLK